jgi:hypothetical protein
VINKDELLGFLGHDTPDRTTRARVRKFPVKQKLLRLLDVLGLGVGDLPAEGYSPEQVMDTQSRTHHRAKKLYNEITREAVNSLFGMKGGSLCSEYL